MRPTDTDEAQFTEPVTVRFSKKQLTAIERQANHLALKTGTYIRMQALSEVYWEDDSQADDGREAVSQPRARRPRP